MKKNTKGILSGIIASTSYGMNPLFGLPLYAQGIGVDVYKRQALGSMLVGAAFTALGGGTDDWGRNMLIFGSLGAAGGGLRGTMQRLSLIHI